MKKHQEILLAEAKKSAENFDRKKAVIDLSKLVSKLADKGVDYGGDDPEMAEAYFSDAFDIQYISDRVKSKDDATAAAVAMDLDTAARNRLPDDVWYFLQSVDKPGKKGGDYDSKRAPFINKWMKKAGWEASVDEADEIADGPAINETVDTVTVNDVYAAMDAVYGVDEYVADLRTAFKKLGYYGKKIGATELKKALSAVHLASMYGKLVAKLGLAE